jgi:hypothetical protein
MKVELATSPGGSHGANEDFVGAAPGVVVLLDGAGIPGTEELCHHGVAWYAHTLGATLLAGLARDPGADLADALAASIEQVADRHRDSCDLANPSSPQATVAIVRLREDRLDHLVLADAFVVLDPVVGSPQVVTDPREVETRGECTAPLRDLEVGSPEYERVRGEVIEAFRARRNQPGGYWIAKDDPQAAAEAVTGSVPVAELAGVALLSNGASRAVDTYGLVDWPALMTLLRASGPDQLLRRVRAAEDGGAAGVPDDATAAYCAFNAMDD